MSRAYVLDANVLLDIASGSPLATGRISEILRAALSQQTLPLVSLVNWGEVFYLVWERRGEEEARRVLSTLSRLPIELVSVDLEQTLRAGAIKACHKIPYVDCFAAALAELRQATLVTSERDFQKLGRRISILWITRP